MWGLDPDSGHPLRRTRDEGVSIRTGVESCGVPAGRVVSQRVCVSGEPPLGEAVMRVCVDLGFQTKAK